MGPAGASSGSPRVPATRAETSPPTGPITGTRLARVWREIADTVYEALGLTPCEPRRLIKEDNQ